MGCVIETGGGGEGGGTNNCASMVKHNRGKYQMLCDHSAVESGRLRKINT